MDKNSYDEIVYDQLPHRQGSLRALETIADIYGLSPVDIRACRVLELGTGTGKTLLPQAEEFPESAFLGIDLSAAQIADGRRIAEEIGLKNIELRCGNIMDVGPDWGRFDYILAHGIYSWVPSFVQEKILDICRANMTPNGIAMISYNTYPGWHGKEMVRKLLHFHTRRARSILPAREEIREARAVLDYFARMKSRQDGYDASVFKMLQSQLAESPDAYVFHEFLEEDNHPCYFVDFHDRLRSRSLEHVADFDWNCLECCMVQSELGDFLRPVSSRRDREQYVDFFVNRMFRADLICHAEAAATLAVRGDIGKRYPMRMSENIRIEQTPNGTWEFQSGFGDASTVRFPIPVSTINDLLVDWFAVNRPYYFTYERLRSEWFQAAARVGVAIAESGELEALLGRFLRLGILQASLRADTVVNPLPEQPRAPGFARCLAGRRCNKIPNADFETLEMSPALHVLVPRLDGRHTIPDLVRHLRAELPGDERTAESVVESTLDRLRRFRLFVE